MDYGSIFINIRWSDSNLDNEFLKKFKFGYYVIYLNLFHLCLFNQATKHPVKLNIRAKLSEQLQQRYPQDQYQDQLASKVAKSHQAQRLKLNKSSLIIPKPHC